MVFKTMSKVFVALVAICMALPVVAQTTTGGVKTKIEKPVFRITMLRNPTISRTAELLLALDAPSTVFLMVSM